MPCLGRSIYSLPAYVANLSRIRTIQILQIIYKLSQMGNVWLTSVIIGVWHFYTYE